MRAGCVGRQRPDGGRRDLGIVPFPRGLSLTPLSSSGSQGMTR